MATAKPRLFVLIIGLVLGLGALSVWGAATLLPESDEVTQEAEADPEYFDAMFQAEMEAVEAWEECAEEVDYDIDALGDC